VLCTTDAFCPDATDAAALSLRLGPAPALGVCRLYVRDGADNVSWGDVVPASRPGTWRVGAASGSEALLPILVVVLCGHSDAAVGCGAPPSSRVCGPAR